MIEENTAKGKPDEKTRMDLTPTAFVDRLVTKDTRRRRKEVLRVARNFRALRAYGLSVPSAMELSMRHDSEIWEGYDSASVCSTRAPSGESDSSPGECRSASRTSSCCAVDALADEFLVQNLQQMGFESNSCHRAAVAAVGMVDSRQDTSRLALAQAAVTWLLDHAADASIHDPLPSASSVQHARTSRPLGIPATPTALPSDGESWAVLIAGGEADTFDMFNLHHIFNFCVDRLGRSHVILIANVAEVHQMRRRAAESGVPELSPTRTREESKAFRQRKLDEFERNFSRVLSEGSADYDYADANAETVVRVLTGQARKKGEKVIPHTGVRSVFICYGGHGGSFRSVPRLSALEQEWACDLCLKPHIARPVRDTARAEQQWAAWLHEDFNYAFVNMQATMSAEHDQVWSVDARRARLSGPAGTACALRMCRYRPVPGAGARRGRPGPYALRRRARSAPLETRAIPAAY